MNKNMMHAWKELKEIVLVLFLFIYVKSFICTNNHEYVGKRSFKRYNSNSSVKILHRRETSQDGDSIHEQIANLLDKEKIKENSRSYSEYPHPAGSERNIKLGERIEKTWEEYDLDKVEKFEYDALLTSPDKPAEIILSDGGRMVKSLVVVAEPSFEGNETVTEPVILPFAAFSKGGTIEGEIVYCNYGKRKDYELLLSLNVVLKDKIFLVRLGANLTRVRLIKTAVKYGGAALLVFPDPADSSYPGQEYPNGWMASRFGVQRGSIRSNAKYMGDLLSEGYPSKHGYFREKKENVEKYLHKIVVQPISSFLAYELMDFMDDDSISIPESFKGNLKVKYNLQIKKGKKVTLKVHNKFEDSKILVVCGTIYGAVEPDRYVLMGNHRDAWIYGAADPVSGTAIMSEIARVLGKRKKKFRPRRSIMFCSWDGEESGTIGSVEWVQQHVDFVSKRVVAYINIDIAVEGNYTIELKSSPILAKTFFEATRKVASPNNESINIYQDLCHTQAKLKHLSQDLQEPGYEDGKMHSSDTLVFMNRFSLPISDYRYTYNTNDFPRLKAFPQYHTTYDNFKWMSTFVDPMFKYHLAIGKLWLLHSLSLSDSKILPFDLESFVDDLQKAFFKLEKKYGDMMRKNDVDVEPVKSSISLLKVKTSEFNKAKDKLDLNTIELRIVNDIISDFSKQFLAQTATKKMPMRVIYREGRFRQLELRLNSNAVKWDSVRKQLTLILWCIDTAIQSLDLTEVQYRTDLI